MKRPRTGRSRAPITFVAARVFPTRVILALMATINGATDGVPNPIANPMIEFARVTRWISFPRHL